MTKKELRKTLRERRAAIPAEQKKEYDNAIVGHVLRSELFQKASMILLYVPVESEVGVLPLARAARSMGKPIAFPRCDTATETMEFFYLRPDERLSPGAYNIPEPPADAERCVPDEHALCIVPALSFDLYGNRLGYGKGYYDRYLATFPGISIGVMYATTMLKRIPTDPHDLPVNAMVTEHGLIMPERLPEDGDGAQPNKKERKKRERGEGDEKNPLRALRSLDFSKLGATFKQAAGAVWQYLCNLVRDARTQDEHGIRALHGPQILVLVSFLMLLLSRVVESKFLDRGNEYIGVILLQVLIFLIPAILYTKLRGEKFTDRIRIRPIKAQQIPFVLLVLVLMITGSLLSSIMTGGINSLVGNFTLYNTFTAKTGNAMDVLYSVFAYALLPAIGEELIYRSILCAEYEKYGVGVSITVSSLTFAMLHFSFAHFPTYFLLGLLLSGAMYATRSLFTPLILHLCYNVFCLFGQPYLSSFYVHAGSTEIFLFCLIVILLLAAALTAGEARKIYHTYADENADSSYTVSVHLAEYPKRILFSVFTPAAGAVLLLWLIMATVHLF